MFSRIPHKSVQTGTAATQASSATTRGGSMELQGPSYTFLPGLRPVRDQWQHSPRATLPLNRREILFYTLALLRPNLSAQSPEGLCKIPLFFSSASRNPFEQEFFTALLGTKPCLGQPPCGCGVTNVVPNGNRTWVRTHHCFLLAKVLPHEDDWASNHTTAGLHACTLGRRSRKKSSTAGQYYDISRIYVDR